MNKQGIVRKLAFCLAALLVLTCAFYLSFSFRTSSIDKKMLEQATDTTTGKVDSTRLSFLQDSIAQEKVWFGYTLKECREKEINLGLDLKGGMNVTMEVEVSGIIRALADDNQSENFNRALKMASEKQENSGKDYVTLFVESYQEIDPQIQLAGIFSTPDMNNRISSTSTNEEVAAVLREEVDAAITNSFNVLRTRIDRFGVVQPNIQRLSQTGRILIELPGIKEPERVRKLLQGSANLEFWETYNLTEIFSNLERLDGELVKTVAEKDTTNGEEVAEVAEAEEVKNDTTTKDVESLVAEVKGDSTKQTKEDIEEFRKNHPLFSKLQANVASNNQVIPSPVVGMAHFTDTAKINALLTSPQARQILPSDVVFRWTVKAIDNANAYYQLIALKGHNGRASLEGNVVTDARADFSQTSAYANVSMSMNADGAKAWQRITKENIGKSVAIVLDGLVYSFPTVQNEISGGNSQITGNFTVEEAKDLANTLKSGKMPAPARIIQEDVVGPSLGREAIQAGLWSFVLGFCLILLYMIFYYGVIPGLIADFALLCNVFLLVGVLASFSAVLTLPGIAGIVLTMGCAVDANVLIYERIREELKSGKKMRQAITDGFQGAISAIVDSNVTSFLTGAILAIFGTGPIKGFAVTYMIGIVTSFITAVFITRWLLEAYANREDAKELEFTTPMMRNFLQNAKVNFVGLRKVSYILSSVLIIVAILGLDPHIFGKLNLGIDFSGGRNYIVRFDQPVSTEAVKSSLDGIFRQNLQGDDTYSLNVITIGNENQIRISTNYMINDQSAAVDEKIEEMIYTGSKQFLAKEIPFEDFRSTLVNPEVGIMQSQKVGPAIADDITTAAVWAVLAALVVIFLYILLRFRNFAYSVGALAALAHDTVIILGLYAILWKIMPFSMEIDQSFIAAILTVIGYSINDTVVIFDRVREYNKLYPKRAREENINAALNNTLSRTFSTSMSTFVVLLAIFSFGGETIRGFVFALLMGVIVGTYSSVFIASPIAFDIQRARQLRAEKKALKK
ncbi:MAG: protein translocase subunit SecDF [Paludibacteraceae bacterium]|nr:protein translocase subunit SecDF [Paludibacteraceae bacterium]MBQ2608668.1 protein translocase subunit SecDF [Paludibacteraceae bacterium]